MAGHIRKLWAHPQYRKYIFKIISNIIKNESMGDMDKIIKRSSDAEFYAYYHQKFREQPEYKDYDKNKMTEQKKLYALKVTTLDSIIPLKGKRILDIGTEDCYFIDLLNEKSNVIVDGLNIGSIGSYRGEKNCITLYDGINIPFSDSTFDVITILMTIHHMDKPEETLKEVHRVLKKGGMLIFYEHDFLDDKTNMVIDFIHFYYELIYNSIFNSPYYADYVIRRNTKRKLNNILTNVGFINESDKLQASLRDPSGNMRMYYGMYIK